MSIEIVFHPKSASKPEIKQHLLSLGFRSCQHLWDWPKESLHFHWFEERENLSFDGVEATIFPRSVEEKLREPGSDWGLHTRTRASASTGDLKQQNLLIKTARRKFGGNFLNDWHGRNRYIPIERDRRDAVARGIYLCYENATGRLSAVRYALPKPIESFQKLMGTKLEGMAQADPTRVLYNALVPFAVAALEHFFSQSFKILLRFERGAQERLLQQSKKIDMTDVLAIRNGKKNIEDVVADWYSFQSISAIHAAFHEWFGIDFRGIIRRRKRIGTRLPFLERRLTELIEFRHGLVHRFEINMELQKEQIEEILDLVRALIDVFVEELEKRRGTPIRD